MVARLSQQVHCVLMLPIQQGDALIQRVHLPGPVLGLFPGFGNLVGRFLKLHQQFGRICKRQERDLEAHHIIATGMHTV